jgi:predicted phosphodiesterase
VGRSRKRYLLISDTHIPFQAPELDFQVECYAGQVDGLIIAGDFLDEYAISRFVKNKEITLQSELLKGYELLEKWSGWFEEIHIMPGNHDERIDTHVAGNLEPTTLFLFGENIVLRKYVDGFKIKGEDGEIIDYPSIPKLILHDKWYFRMGDAIIAHPKNFSKVPGRVAVMAGDYFKEQGEEFNAILIGHTHKAIKMVKSGKLLMECGCSCKEQDYAGGGKLTYTPQVKALTILVQKNGVTDFNETNFLVY